MLISIFPKRDEKVWVEDGKLVVTFIDKDDVPIRLELLMPPNFRVEKTMPTGNAYDIDLYYQGEHPSVQLTVFTTENPEVAKRLAEWTYENLRLISSGLTAEDVMKLYRALNSAQKEKFKRLLGVKE